MTCLKTRGHVINHQVLDNEASKEYRRHVTDIWSATYQLVTPNVHRSNIAERAIRTFKAHFLSILAGIPPSFPNYLCEKLLPQTELSLNLLRQSTIAPLLFAWETFNGPFNFDATPFGPIGCRFLIHNKPSTRASWAYRSRDGFYVGPALQHYHCFQVVDTTTKSTLIFDNVEFRHKYLTQPTTTHADRLTHALHLLSSALRETPSAVIDAQLDAIRQLRDLFQNWTRTTNLQDPSPPPPTPPPPTRVPPHRPPRVAPLP